MMALIWACVRLGGMTGLEPGLIGATKGMRDNVLHTASDTQSHSRPRTPFPKWLIMDAALVLRRNLSPWRESKPG